MPPLRWSHATNSMSQLLAALDEDPPPSTPVSHTATPAIAASSQNAAPDGRPSESSRVPSESSPSSMTSQGRGLAQDSQQRVLSLRKYDAIEADFCWNTTLSVAVVRHATVSAAPAGEETLAEEWLRVALGPKRSDRVIKLDFKNLKCVEPCLALISSLSLSDPELRGIMLNGDVLAGPGCASGAAPTIEGEAFLRQCSSLPSCILSLGWVTRFDPFREIVYDGDHVEAMIDLLRRHDLLDERRVATFPVRASLARTSWPALQQLLRLGPDNFSLTLWTSSEGVPQEDLEWAEETISSKQLYVDCDKGPKHDWRSVKRVSYYLGFALRRLVGRE